MSIELPIYKELSGRVAVVTGAAKGMGAMFAAGLAKQGVHVYALDIDPQGLDRSAQHIRQTLLAQNPHAGTIEPVQCDVTSRESLQQLAQRIGQQHGQLHIWVNNAGIFPKTDLDSASVADVNQAFAINVNGVFFGAQAAASVMRNGGVIINMASVAAFRVRPGRSVYCATKTAVDSLTRSMAVEWGERGIRVNAIAPGFIDTEMTAWIKESPTALEQALRTVPLNRIGRPEEVLAALLFLVSDCATYITAQTLGVDGGSRYG